MYIPCGQSCADKRSDAGGEWLQEHFTQLHIGELDDCIGLDAEESTYLQLQLGQPVPPQPTDSTSDEDELSWAAQCLYATILWYETLMLTCRAEIDLSWFHLSWKIHQKLLAILPSWMTVNKTVILQSFKQARLDTTLQVLNKMAVEQDGRSPAQQVPCTHRNYSGSTR